MDTLSTATPVPPPVEAKAADPQGVSGWPQRVKPHRMAWLGGATVILAVSGAGRYHGAVGRVIFTTAPILPAFSCAFLTGIVFGCLPARKVARLDPIEALARD